jgi:hypothetical protein
MLGPSKNVGWFVASIMVLKYEKEKDSGFRWTERSAIYVNSGLGYKVRVYDRCLLFVVPVDAQDGDIFPFELTSGGDKSRLT